METFLKEVAQDLYTKNGGNMADTVVVFPNKRASLFFNEHLARQARHPIWAPSYRSISELFRDASPLKTGDSVELVCHLYKIFVEATGSKETLDEFYFWGEMLIADFDDADKNLVDTATLFSNLKDLNDISESYDFLEEEQKEAIRRFFHNFAMTDTTELKRRFAVLWNALGSIYQQFRDTLRSRSLAYEGMLYRDVIEHYCTDQFPARQYVFVGFNVLNRVELQLFKKLHAEGRALFYWDYDNFYLSRSPHEAGEFIRRNLQLFPNELPPDRFNHLGRPKDITYVASPTENGQSRYLPQWLRENLTPEEKETAAVLCNEELLQPVLHALPENVRNLNITMGFPLGHTPAASFAAAIMELHIGGYHTPSGRFLFKQVVSLLRHPYTRLLSDKAEDMEKRLIKHNRFYPHPAELQDDEIMARLFTPCNGNRQLCQLVADMLKKTAVLRRRADKTPNDTMEQLYAEALFSTYTLINRFSTLVENGNLDVRPETLQRLLARVSSSTSIPFHGEPAVGLQVMGVLETRNLDFRHLIMLSVGEGRLPKSGGDASFIPYNLRKAFGMTTIDHKIAVYAYYFYRLMQRAEKITLVYNTATDGLFRGERSRFMLQFLVEWPYPIKQLQLKTGQSPMDSDTLAVYKTPSVMHRLQDRFDTRANEHALLSPSALNCYIDCRLKFYYKYVARLETPEEVSEEIDAALFGSIFHHAAEHIYNDLAAHDHTISRQAIEDLLKNGVKVQQYVDNAFKALFFGLPENKRPEYNGLQFINASVIIRYIRQLLRQDLKYAPFRFVASEHEVYENIDVNTPKGVLKIRIGGIIDRMDSKDGNLRIVDYKTGGAPVVPRDIESLFVRAPKRPSHVFQTFLYSAIVCRRMRETGRETKVAPALLYIHRAAADNYSPAIQMGEPRKTKETVDDFNQYESVFREHLQTLLEEIFNPDIPFKQTDDENKCAYCDFKALCRR